MARGKLFKDFHYISNTQARGESGTSVADETAVKVPSHSKSKRQGSVARSTSPSVNGDSALDSVSTLDLCLYANHG